MLMKKDLKTALYARVSTSDKGQDPELQLSALRDYCRKRGWQIYREYIDFESGAKEDRKQLKQMLKEASQKKFDILLVWKLDRLARSLKQLIQILETLKAFGIEFKCLNQDIDTTTPSGKLLFYLIGAFAEFERDLISERVKAGMAKAKQEGKKLGRKRIADEIVKAVIEDRKQGMSIRQIAKKHKISKGTVSNILKQREKEVEKEV